jgi:hypothetical protein
MTRLFKSSLVVSTLEDRCVPAATLEPINVVELPKSDPVEARAELPAGEESTDPTVTIQTLSNPPAPPAVEIAKRFAVGSGAGSTAIINVYSTRTNALLTTYTPFGPSYTGGVRVATADFNGDGIDDVAAVAATGTPKVMVFDGLTGTVLSSLTPGSNATGGAFLAAGDVTGDGRADLVIGSGVGQTPTIQVYNGTQLIGNNPIVAQTIIAANSDSKFGVRVAVGDLNGDGIAEIVSASKNIVTIQSTSRDSLQTAFARRGALNSTPMIVRGLPTGADTNGMFVSVGDFTGSGKADIAVGYVSNGVARVRVVSGQNNGRMLMTSFGFTQVAAGGVPVTMRDLTGSGRQSVIAAGGEGTSQVRVLNAGIGGLARSFMSMTPSYRGGVFVG